MVSATGGTELRERDVLLVDMSASEVDLREFCREQMLEPMVLRGEYFSEQSRDVGLAEVSMNPDSELLGKSLREIKFRTRYGLNVVAIRREGVLYRGKLLMSHYVWEMCYWLLVIGN